MSAAECERLGVTVNYNVYAEMSQVMEENPDYVVVATGGVPDLSLLKGGEELATTSWDILGGAVHPAQSIIVVDNNGSHPAMTIAEYIANANSELELITPDRILAPEIGATNYPPHLRSLNAANVKITLNLRIDRLERKGNKIVAVFLDEYANREITKEADQIVVEYGTQPLDELYFQLKPYSVNLGEVDYKAMVGAKPQNLIRNSEGKFRLFRIGDAVSSRNIHAAIFDAYRLMMMV